MTDSISLNPLVWDPALSEIIEREKEKQAETMSFIASENHMSAQLLDVLRQAALFNNEYAEGYPKKRYYGGCRYVDEVEELAIFRAKKLFGVEYANVQPHAGSQANAAVLMALLSPGDCFLGMKLAHGGHLTHGAKVSFSGHFYSPVSYGVDAKGFIDYDEVEALAKAHRPKLIIAGSSAYSRVIDWKRFREIATEVGAYLLADIAHIAGLVVAGEHPSPVPFADVITTTTHKTLRGPRGGLILARDAEFAKKKKLDRAVFPGLQGGPLVQMIATKAAAFHEALQPEFKVYQAQIVKNAKQMAEVLKARGFPIVSGGTDNHLLLVDLSNRGVDVSGKTAEAALESAHIITNKNMLPDDKRSPSETSGLRLGTPAITTRGLKEQEVTEIAHWIADILEDIENHDKISEVRANVIQLCRDFPIYNL